MLKNGNPNGKGGKREGAGRLSGSFTRKCLKIASQPKALKFLNDVITGKGVEPTVVWNRKTKKNEVIMVPASADTRVKVWEKVGNRGAGSPPQALMNPDGSNLSGLVLIRAAA